MVFFNEIRDVLLDPSPSGQNLRNQLALEASAFKIISAVAMVLGFVASGVGLGRIEKCPLEGILLTFGGACFAAVSHDFMQVSSNIEETARGSGLFGNIWTRVRATWSKENFVDMLFKDTWVLNPLFRTMVIYGLGDDDD